jgi:hypothetical protein
MCRKDGGCCGRGSRPKGRASRRPLRPPSAEPARWATLFRDEPTTNRLGEQMGTSRGCVPTSSARIRVVAPRATVKHSRRRHSAAGRAARARPASARSRAVAVECADELVCDLARQQRCMRSAPSAREHSRRMCVLGKARSRSLVCASVLSLGLADTRPRHRSRMERLWSRAVATRGLCLAGERTGERLGECLQIGSFGVVSKIARGRWVPRGFESLPLCFLGKPHDHAASWHLA